MRWKEESSRCFSDLYEGDDILLAMDIISEAYDEGFINWYIYREAKDRIKTNLKSSWMFKQEKERETNETENEESNETKYITENMGEITVTDNGFKYIYGKYNSEKIQIANLGLISFKFNENFDYIMNIINQYDKIYKISKKAIIKKFKNDENIIRFFNPYYSLEIEELYELIKKANERNIRKIVDPDNSLKEKEVNKSVKKINDTLTFTTFLNYCDSCGTLENLLILFGIDAFEGFDINKAVNKLKYPRLYFADNFFGSYGDEKIYFAVQYSKADGTDEADLILEVFMDSNLKVYGFDTCRSIPIDLK